MTMAKKLRPPNDRHEQRKQEMGIAPVSKATIKQTPIQLDAESMRRMAYLAAAWGFSSTKHTTAVVRRSISDMYAAEVARRTMSDADFLGWLAEYFQPIE